MPVEIAPLPRGRLPDPVEAAVYFVVAEALTNITRYAHATYARIAVTTDGDVVDGARDTMPRSPQAGETVPAWRSG